MFRTIATFTVLNCILLSSASSSSETEILQMRERYSALKERVNHVETEKSINLNKHTYAINKSQEIMSKILLSFGNSMASFNLSTEKASFCQSQLVSEMYRSDFMDGITQRALRIIELMNRKYELDGIVGRGLIRTENLMDKMSLNVIDIDGKIPSFETIHRQMNKVLEDIKLLESTSAAITKLADAQIEAVKEMQAFPNKVKQEIEKKLVSHGCLK